MGQVPMGPLMPPQQPRMPMRQRVSNDAMMKDAFPKWLTQYGMGVYLTALMVVSFLYSSHALPWYYVLSGVVTVSVFFLYGSKAIKDTAIVNVHKAKSFENRIFITAFILRVIFVLLLYEIFMNNYPDAMGWENGDAPYYHELGMYVSELIQKGDYHFYDRISQWSGNSDIADMGYGIYIGSMLEEAEN